MGKLRGEPGGGENRGWFTRNTEGGHFSFSGDIEQRSDNERLDDLKFFRDIESKSSEKESELTTRLEEISQRIEKAEGNSAELEEYEKQLLDIQEDIDTFYYSHGLSGEDDINSYSERQQEYLRRIISGVDFSQGIAGRIKQKKYEGNEGDPQMYLEGESVRKKIGIIRYNINEQVDELRDEIRIKRTTETAQDDNREY